VSVDSLYYKINSLRQCYSGCITHKEFIYDDNAKIHHSQVTVKRGLLDKVKFSEESIYINREDCVFCYNIFNLPNIKNAYIQNELSYYISSNSQGYMIE
jgi:hypothetical protein